MHSPKRTLSSLTPVTGCEAGRPSAAAATDVSVRETRHSPTAGAFTPCVIVAVPATRAPSSPALTSVAASVRTSRAMPAHRRSVIVDSTAFGSGDLSNQMRGKLVHSHLRNQHPRSVVLRGESIPCASSPSESPVRSSRFSRHYDADLALRLSSPHTAPALVAVIGGRPTRFFGSETKGVVLEQLSGQRPDCGCRWGRAEPLVRDSQTGRGLGPGERPEYPAVGQAPLHCPVNGAQTG